MYIKKESTSFEKEKDWQIIALRNKHISILREGHTNQFYATKICNLDILDWKFWSPNTSPFFMNIDLLWVAELGYRC